MIRTIQVSMLAAILLMSSAGLTGFVQDAEALKGQGISPTKTGSVGSVVCGDKLCTEIAYPPSSSSTPSSVDKLVCAISDGKTRTYYIAADEIVWDYTPSGKNMLKNESFGEDENVFLETTDSTIGSKYIKAVYQEYTDSTFTELKERTAEWEHLGVLGPVIRAEVCDTIKVVFKNNAEELPYSMHPHGVFYEKDSEGSAYADGTSDSDKSDDAVAPGQTHTYTWKVPPRAGPGPNDPSSITWMYHSHIDSPTDTNSGLVGPIIVTTKGMADENGKPVDVDREFVTLFTVFDENSSNYLCDNLEKFTSEICANEELLEDEGFAESNLMHAINGYMYGNQPGLDMNKGENVRWYLIGMGTEVDLHTPHWHGNTALWSGMRVDVMELMPASLKVVDMIPDNVGTWLYHCHVNDHISAGMSSMFTVR